MRKRTTTARSVATLSLVMALGLASVAWNVTSAQNPESDRERVANRPDVRRCPARSDRGWWSLRDDRIVTCR